MQKRVYTFGVTRLPYFIRGEPQLLLQSGTHGDEFEVIASVKKALKTYVSQLSDFLYIPAASPSAVLRRTRLNKDNVDLNRNFYADTDIEEARANILLLKNYTFDICLSFHEDPELTEFYLYDSGLLYRTDKLSKLKSEIKKCGVNLFTGIDDPTDESLGFEFIEGYRHFPITDATPENGMFTSWAISHEIVKQATVFEIPGKIPRRLKDKLVDIIFKIVAVDPSLRK